MARASLLDWPARLARLALDGLAGRLAGRPGSKSSTGVGQKRPGGERGGTKLVGEWKRSVHRGQSVQDNMNLAIMYFTLLVNFKKNILEFKIPQKF